MCITNWHGIDSSKEINLIKYGLLVRWDRRGKTFQCLYKISSDKWGVSFMTVKHLESILFEDWFEIENLQRFTNSPLSWWLDLPFEQKLYDLIRFIGVVNVFNEVDSYKTTKEAYKLARVDYSPKYAVL